MSELYESTSKQEWEQARRTAFIQDVLGAFTERSVDLLPFEQVRQKLHLLNARYLGLQEVPLDHIVGSVGRSRDFTRTFFPRVAGLQDRWQRVNQLIAKESGAPSIELYKVGQVYFLRDGNHRVSVAKQHNVPTIEAYVWEYEVPAVTSPGSSTMPKWGM
jgi:hypothetical protein